MAGKNFSKYFYMGWQVWAHKCSIVVMAGKGLNAISDDKKFKVKSSSSFSNFVTINDMKFPSIMKKTVIGIVILSSRRGIRRTVITVELYVVTVTAMSLPVSDFRIRQWCRCLECTVLFILCLLIAS